MTLSNMVKKRPGELSLVTWVKNRIHRNENANIMVTGPTGSGKSYACLSLAKQIDPDFDPDTQIVFSFKDLLTTIRRYNNDIPDEQIAEGMKPLHKRKYKVIIFEEFQISGNAQDWYNKLSKLLNMLLSTYRHQNFILFINAPFSDMINSQSRRLFHMVIEMKGKDEKRKLATVRPKILEYNQRQREFYEHSIYAISNGKANKTPIYKLKKADDAICERYEQMKKQFTSALNAKIEAELIEFEKENQPKAMQEKDYKTDLNPDSMQPTIWEEAQKGYKTQMELAERVGDILNKHIDIGNFNRNVTSMRKKSYDIRLFKDKS